MATPASVSLSDPLQIGGVRLPNRLMMAPMGSCQADERGLVTEQTVAYYRRRAAGGVGAITVEAALIAPETHGHEPGIHGPEFLPGLRRVATTIKDYGVVAGIQLMHPGRQVTSGPAVAPSPVPLNSASPVPEELTEEEIARIVRLYGEAARRAEEAGYEYVEVHGAHGYLPSDFLSPVANRRTDGYGGDAERRARFVVEVAEAIVSAVDIPLFWRLSGEELRPGGFTVEDQVQVARWLQSAGVAAISVSAGTWHTLGVTVAPMSVPRGHMLGYASSFKAALDIPVIAVGRLDDPTLAARVVAEDLADVVLLGRGLLADPDWASKVLSGRADQVRPCIACNACVDLVGRGLDLRCAVNPETGRESTWRVVPAAEERRVLVVGGGPAGMSAAAAARERGHEVVLCERNHQLGGKLDVAARAPSKNEVLRFRDHAIGELDRLGVNVRLAVDVDATVVAEENPDVVIVATGADPAVPPIAGVDGPNVVDAQELLYDRVPVTAGARVVIVGGSATGCETAELLLDHGADVTVLEMGRSIGSGIEAITRRWLIRELRTRGATLETLATVVEITQDAVRYETADGDVTVPADIVALAVGWRSRGPRLAAIVGGRDVVVVGDAERPADFVAATSAGAAAGLRI